jgi:hypothetical protein
LPDLRAHGGLRAQDFFRGAGEAAESRNFYECFELIEVHGRNPSENREDILTSAV